MTGLKFLFLAAVGGFLMIATAPKAVAQIAGGCWSCARMPLRLL